MEKTPENLPDKVRAMVAAREKISLKSSKINARLEKYVLLIITEILIKLGQERYTEMIYIIVKELAINAVKANQKRIFFEDLGLNILDENQYAEGIIKFKQSFSDSMAEVYGAKCQEKGVYVQINFFYKT
ncbi:MAG TPA: histidine kinase, partial [Leptospiraceae bacterium]|nr:histidine kinase [Leptospiraceae bacterium]